MVQEEDTRVIIEQILGEVDQERSDHPDGSYMALVPAKFRRVVRRLADHNFPHYSAQFSGDPAAFGEQMARNWLAKQRSFAILAERAGMSPISRIRARRGDPLLDHASLALLTENASYLLIGPGAFTPTGPGAPFRYRRIPLREGERIPNLDAPAGLRFKKQPRVGRRAITTNISTSPITSMFTGLPDPSSGDSLPAYLGPRIDDTFSRTDTITITGVPVMPGW